MSKELIKELRAIEAYGETLISGYEARKYADAMEEMETENGTLREQLVEKEIELQAMRNAANQYKRDFTRVTKELDAALDDLSGFCWTCAHGKPAKIRTGGLTTCDYMREQGTLARGGRCKCKHWQWRGPQKEDNGNDD